MGFTVNRKADTRERNPGVTCQVRALYTWIQNTHILMYYDAVWQYRVQVLR
jgi:hypothetical protein